MMKIKRKKTTKYQQPLNKVPLKEKIFKTQVIELSIS